MRVKGRWAVHWLVIGVLALTVAGCNKQEGTATPKSTTEATPPPAATAPKPEAPAATAKQEGAKVEESAAVQAARKLGTPTDNPVVTLPSGLQYIEVKEGQGEPAKAGDSVQVHYTGWLVDGKEFDSSLRRGKPFPFALGAGRVIRGWDEGVVGMKPGGVRKLIIPPQLGYGPGGYPPVIPPDATLIFEVQYLGKQ
jgi:FKBP-type peptidyl-prolyl cis-trans isomerase FkpA